LKALFITFFESAFVQTRWKHSAKTLELVLSASRVRTSCDARSAERMTE